MAASTQVRAQLEPPLSISGTSGQKCPKRRISAHIHAYQRRRAPIAPPEDILQIDGFGCCADQKPGLIAMQKVVGSNPISRFFVMCRDICLRCRDTSHNARTPSAASLRIPCAWGRLAFPGNIKPPPHIASIWALVPKMTPIRGDCGDFGRFRLAFAWRRSHGRQRQDVSGPGGALTPRGLTERRGAMPATHDHDQWPTARRPLRAGPQPPWLRRRPPGTRWSRKKTSPPRGAEGRRSVVGVPLQP